MQCAMNRSGPVQHALAVPLKSRRITRLCWSCLCSACILHVSSATASTSARKTRWAVILFASRVLIRWTMPPSRQSLAKRRTLSGPSDWFSGLAGSSTVQRLTAAPVSSWNTAYGRGLWTRRQADGGAGRPEGPSSSSSSSNSSCCRCRCRRCCFTSSSSATARHVVVGLKRCSRQSGAAVWHRQRGGKRDTARTDQKAQDGATGRSVGSSDGGGGSDGGSSDGLHFFVVDVIFVLVGRVIVVGSGSRSRCVGAGGCGPRICARVSPMRKRRLQGERRAV